MPAPLILTRAEHPISRRDIDPDALKVLYRLNQAGYVAYLVGGGVRDLLLGRRPKDFDVGTSAHPHQVKRLFRNCWIIGRRFRLAHVKFGTKVIEVATFRKQAAAVEAPDPDAQVLVADAGNGNGGGEQQAQQVHRDNSFGTEIEDAFRRDFTVNALFYDIATFSVIDHVGGIEDLRARLIRCIGDPRVRFVEDPVRMLRAIVLAARLDFKIDEPVLQAIMLEKSQISSASPARLLEEYYKVLRSGAALRAFYLLGEVGLLQLISPELPWPLPHALERSLAAVDDYRARFDRIPETLTNATLLGSLIAPTGLLTRRRPRDPGDGERRRAPGPSLGGLPLARRDVEVLDQAVALQSRLADVANLTQRTQRAVMHRAAFEDALTWMEIHGQQPDVVARWKELAAEPARPQEDDAPADEARPRRRRPRRRRRRQGPRPEGS